MPLYVSAPLLATFFVFPHPTPHPLVRFPLKNRFHPDIDSILCLCITVGTHRALPDVLALEKILTHPSLVTCLSRLPIRSPAQQMKLWIQQKRAHIRTTALVKAIGKPSLTAAQAKRLDVLGLGFNDLLKLHRDSGSRDEFLTAMKDNGIRSGPVREKIVKALQQFSSRQLS